MTQARRRPGAPTGLPGWLRKSFALPNALYDHGAGWLLGHRFVQIGHRGRRSGRSFHTVVEVISYDRVTGETVVLSGFGPRADWYRNILAAGGAELDFGRGPRPAAYDIVSPEEAERVYRDYERRNRLVRPVVRRTLSLLLGWDFDGSSAAVRRMVQELPMVALRPAS